MNSRVCPGCGGKKDYCAKTCRQCQIKQDPGDRFCQTCGERLTRNRYSSGVLEGFARFLSRKTCGQSCGNSREDVTMAALRTRARRFRGKRCERCGSRKNLHAHHRDGDITNNVAENIETVCATCHISGHWEEKREQGRRIYAELRELS